MFKFKLPTRFALVGLLLAFTFMALYWFDYNYNPFHLPPTPALYNFIEKAMFVLCPGAVASSLHHRNERSTRLGYVGIGGAAERSHLLSRGPTFCDDRERRKTGSSQTNLVETRETRGQTGRFLIYGFSLFSRSNIYVLIFVAAWRVAHP